MVLIVLSMRTLVFGLAILACSPAAIAQRLPATVMPTHYALWFAPDLQNATFRGRETIDIDVQQPDVCGDAQRR